MTRQAASGASAVVASVIVGASVLAGSWIVSSSLDRTATQLGAIKTGLADAKGALESVAKAQGAANAPTRRGPDPNKRYAIKGAGAPAKGPLTAKVKIYEFSDFQ